MIERHRPILRNAADLIGMIIEAARDEAGQQAIKTLKQLLKDEGVPKLNPIDKFFAATSG